MFYIVAALIVSGQIIMGGPVKDAEFTTQAACEAARPITEKKLMEDILKSVKEYKKEHPKTSKDIEDMLKNASVESKCVEKKEE